MPALLAVLLGSLIVLAALVPWVAVQYRRRGTLGFGPTLIAVGTVVYALSLLTYTLLPLPSDVAELCSAGGAGQQLRPGQFLRDIATHGGWRLGNPAVLQVGFNVLLFVPLGMLVRYTLLRGWSPLAWVLGAAAVGLLVSLGIETTQLTGNWFLYPCSYRLFDVDDLIANSAGALLGGLISPLLGLLPGQKLVAPVDQPREIRGTRRLLGMVCDALALALTSAALTVAVNALALSLGLDFNGEVVTRARTYVVFSPAFIQLVIVLLAGRTVGEFAVRLRPASAPTVLQRVVRWALGSGGWWLLLQADAPWTSSAATLLAVASVAALWFTRSHRSLAAAVAGIDLADDRTEQAPSVTAA